MNKKLISLLICSIIVFVGSSPTDSGDDGGKRRNNSFAYTESPKTTGAVVNTLANVTGQHISEIPVDRSNKPLAVSVPTGTSSSTVSQPTSNISSNITSKPINEETTTTTSPPSTTTVPTTTNATTTNTTTQPTTQTTTTIITTTTTPTLPPTTTEPTKPSTTTSATTTAAAATTTMPAPTASPSKDRRFDGPSFIGGIVLSLGIMAIGFVAFKFYKARTERNYHTL